MVPDGWQEQSLDKVFKLASGSTKPNDVVSEYRNEAPHPIYGGNGVLGYSAQSNHPGNVILIGRVGEYCGVTRRVTEPCWITDNALYAKDFFPENDIKFITYRLQHFDVSRLRSKGGQPLVSQKPIYLTKFALPPLAEQRKIADILSTWDAAIEKTEALLATAKAQKRALMQSLLTGKRRFPAYEGQPWKDVRLGDVGLVSSAGVDKKTEDNQPEVRLLNFLDVFRREFIFDAELNHVVTAPPAKLEPCNVKRGDVFFTPSSETRDEIAIPAVAAEDMEGVCYSYHVVRFRLSEPWDMNFRAYVFQTDDFRKQAYKLGDGSGQRYVISQGNFRNMTVRVPSIPEQAQIGAILKAASDEIGDLEKQLTKLRTEKKALMQQLLTGKRRVVV